jgi:hypothetical protein
LLLDPVHRGAVERVNNLPRNLDRHGGGYYFFTRLHD